MVDILYQDDQKILCVKQPGTVSQGAKEGAPDLLSALCGQTGLQRLYAVHRLDAGTGGVICVAKTPRAASQLSQAFSGHQVQKEYLCAVSGCPAEPDGEMRDLLYWVASAQKSYVTDHARRGAKEAVLEYHGIQTLDTDAGRVSLMRVILHTGRTHQVRVQFASRGMPLLGDGKYGSREKRCRTALWSSRLILPDGTDVRSAPPDVFPWSLFPDRDI